MHDSISLLNWAGFGWFLINWILYSKFARFMATRSASLSSVMHVHRINWMRRVLQREMRVADASLLANLERNVTFFASSCVLILAGLLTAMTAVEEVQSALESVTVATHDTILVLEFKIGVMIGVFIYGFFTFTWSLRQFGFASVLVGAAPMPDDSTVTAADKRSFAIYAAKIIDQASHSYNYGLRAFYFSLALLIWFVNVWAFMVATTLVVGILYEREFLSKSLKALKKVENVGDMLSRNDNELSRY